MTKPLIGQPVKRVEDDALLRGRGHYTDDFDPAGTVHLKFARSLHPKARIVSIDTSAAQAAPGVITVVTASDLAGLGDMPVQAFPFAKVPPHPLLCRGTVHAVGAPVVAVVAEAAAQAADAALLVAIEYEPLASVSEPEAALEPESPRVFDELDSNVCYSLSRGSGDAEQAIAEADHVVRLRIESPRLAAVTMEPRTVLAVPDASSGLTVWTSTQAPFAVQQELAAVLHYPDNRIRVIAPDVGGGFGAKGAGYREDMLAAWLALRLNRPVKWVATRTEDMLSTTQGRDMAVTVELAARNDGTLTAFRTRTIANLGAYLHTYTALPPMAMIHMAPGSYRIANVRAEVVGVFTNTTSTGPYRGAGRPEAVMAIERMIEQMARELGMDPVEIRRKNLIQPDEFPYQNVMHVTYDSGDYGKALDRALELAGYEQLVQQRGERRQRGDLVGIGLSTFVEPAGGMGFESGLIRVERSGRVTLVTGASSHGQGHETVFAQVVADALAVPFEHVRVLHGDTGGTPIGTGTHGSRSAVIGGGAIVRSAEAVLAKAKRIAAAILEASPEDIVLAEGGLTVTGAPHKMALWADIAKVAYTSPPAGEEPGLEATSYFDTRGQSAWSFGTHLACVSVVRETGQVTIERFVAVDDCGTVLNPMIVEGQLQGGIVQGMGEALLEHVVFDDQGQTLTSTLMDYAVPRATHIPPIILDQTHTPSPTNPLGVKGVGEAGTNGSPAAIANAVMDALSPLGIKHVDMPYTAPKIWKAIADSRR